MTNTRQLKSDLRLLKSRNQREGWYCGRTKIADMYGFKILQFARHLRRGKTERQPLKFEKDQS